MSDASTSQPTIMQAANGQPGGTPDQHLRLTEGAEATVRAVRVEEADGDRLALWLEISGINGAAYSYDMWFQLEADAGAGDVVQHHGDLAIVIPAASADKLRGATLDVDGSPEGGLVIVNPNAPPSSRQSPAMGTAPPGDLTGPVAEQVATVLDEQVNPSIAMHGGYAELVSVDGEIAYVRLSGGCQGCGLAQVTLGQGIAVAIKEAVPAITEVIDVTDHAGGTNPFYEPAKK